jgi:DNA polymerase-1
MASESGISTNACFGFTNMLLKILQQEKPTHIAVTFDQGKATFRHLLYDAYKGTRKETPEDLPPQFSLIKRVLRAYGISFFESPDYEADDLIGTLATVFAPQIMVNILTGDRDMLQLVAQGITVILIRKSFSDLKMFHTEDDVRTHCSLQPCQLIDYKGLAGDACDNIPGVPGIGDKIATRLLQEYGSIETILECRKDLSGKLCSKLEQFGEQAILSKRLATIVRDVPMEIELEQLACREPDYTALVNVFNELEFRGLATRYAPRVRQVPLAEQIAPKMKQAAFDFGI